MDERRVKQNEKFSKKVDILIKEIKEIRSTTYKSIKAYTREIEKLV